MDSDKLAEEWVGRDGPRVAARPFRLGVFKLASSGDFMRPLSRLCCALALAFTAIPLLPAGAQSPRQNGQGVALQFTRELHLRSSINGQEYRLMVAVPPTYSVGDSTRYNVLYVLDGNDEWPLAVEAHRMRRAAPGAAGPEVLIVGIGYPTDTYRESMPLRSADLTTEPGIEDSVFIRPSGLSRHTGEGIQFTRVLRDEIIPLIDREYRTTNDRGIIGHSLGAGFVSYLLFAQTDLFSRYGMLSANFLRDSAVAHERAYASTHRALNKHVFISQASQDGPFVMRTTGPMLNTLKARKYAGLSLDFALFQDETHFSVLPAAIGRALKGLGYDP